jgi:predicted nuclease with TOPRIM domain
MAKLSQEEIQGIKYLVNTYSNLWMKSEEFTSRLEELSRERDSLLREIERLDEEMNTVKEQEKVLEMKLKNRYGNFKLDMDTFEIFIID